MVNIKNMINEYKESKKKEIDDLSDRDTLYRLLNKYQPLYPENSFRDFMKVDGHCGHGESYFIWDFEMLNKLKIETIYTLLVYLKNKYNERRYNNG